MALQTWSLGQPSRRKPVKVEEPIHIQIVNYLRAVLPDALVWHPANGGYRNKSDAARFKRMGVIPGIPDLILWTGEGRTFGLEIKTDVGRLSKEQKAIHEWMKRSGLQVAVVRSIDDVRAALAAWGVETREAAQ
jgi:hypothetical protein